jgi:hypothetical protein
MDVSSRGGACVVVVVGGRQSRITHWLARHSSERHMQPDQVALDIVATCPSPRRDSTPHPRAIPTASARAQL